MAACGPPVTHQKQAIARHRQQVQTLQSVMALMNYQHEQRAACLRERLAATDEELAKLDAAFVFANPQARSSVPPS